MNRALKAGLLACALCAAGVAVAGTTKFSFINITYPDGSTGTIRAGSKIVKNSVSTICDYYAAPNDAYIGRYESSTFATEDAIQMEDFCYAHYFERI